MLSLVRTLLWLTELGEDDYEGWWKAWGKVLVYVSLDAVTGT